MSEASDTEFDTTKVRKELLKLCDHGVVVGSVIADKGHELVLDAICHQQLSHPCC